MVGCHLSHTFLHFFFFIYILLFLHNHYHNLENVVDQVHRGDWIDPTKKLIEPIPELPADQISRVGSDTVSESPVSHSGRSSYTWCAANGVAETAQRGAGTKAIRVDCPWRRKAILSTWNELEA